MESINNLVIGKNSLKIRLIIALLSINLLILLYGGISIYLVNELYAQAKITTSQTLPMVQQTNEFNQELSRFRRNLSRATLAADQNEQSSIKLKLTEGRQKILQISKNLEQFANTDGEKASLKEMEKAVNSFFDETEDMIRISNSSFDPTLKMKLTSSSLSKFEELMMRLHTIEEEFGKNSLKASENLTVLFASNQSVTGVTLFLITVFLVILSIRTLTTILRPINRSIDLVTDYSKGNFTAEIPEEKTLEYGKIFTAFGNMAAKLSDVIRNIRKVSAGILKSSGSLVSRSDTLSGLSQEMAASSEESSASIEELSTSLENVGKSITSQTKNMYEIESNINSFTESIDEIKKSSERLAMISNEAAKRASGGESTIRDTSTAMDKIKTSSSKITEIVGLISNISSQTNLLSLNAAIEAARAGEAGRGFAVVADNISKLADRTVHGVKEIQTLIADTDAAIKDGFIKVEEVSVILRSIINSVNNVNNSVNSVLSAVNDQVENITSIADNVRKATNFSKEIETASLEQKNAVKEINQGVANISNIAQTISIESHQLREIAGNFNSLSEELKENVDYFKVK